MHKHAVYRQEQTKWEKIQIKKKNIEKNFIRRKKAYEKKIKFSQKN